MHRFGPLKIVSILNPKKKLTPSFLTSSNHERLVFSLNLKREFLKKIFLGFASLCYMLLVFKLGTIVKKFLTESHSKREFFENELSDKEDRDLEIDDEKDCEEEELKSTRDNFLLWKIFQEEP